MGKERRPEAEAVVGLLPRVIVLAALTGASLAHATVTGEHVEEWGAAGAFFLTLTVLEVGLGVLALLAWSRGVALAVVASSLVTVGIWGMSRTVGTPFGPVDFRVPEAVGRLDLVCVVLELVAAGICAATLARPAGSQSPAGRSGLAGFLRLGGG